MTLVSLLFAILAQPLTKVRNERQLISQLEKKGAIISIKGTVMQDFSLGRAILKYFSPVYDRDFFYIVDFSGSSVSDEDLESLRKLPYLYHLNLSNTKVSDTGLDTVALCPTLHELDLSYTKISDSGILKLKPLEKLIWLKTDMTAVTYSSLSTLDDELVKVNFAEQRALAEIKALGGQASVVRSLSESKEYPRINVVEGGEKLGFGELILGMNRKLKLDKTDISHIAYLKSIQSLIIHSIHIDAGSFADLPMMPMLNEFEIQDTEISDFDLQCLAKQIQLKKIGIYYTKEVTDVGINELAKLINLKKLMIYGCPNVTENAISYLREQLPECEIEYR